MSDKKELRSRGHHTITRGIVERIHIQGKLVLETPAHFGSGMVRGDSLVDMSLLLDDAEGGPSTALLPGTTIAGALRNYLRERLQGYGVAESDEDFDRPIAWLFGPNRHSDSSADQSLLIVDDAFAQQPERTLRDGVRIDETSGLAYEDDRGGAKFDVELLEAGTTFDLHIELLITKGHENNPLVPYLVTALQGFENGEIRLGLRKRRGYGQCRISEWQVDRFKMRAPKELCRWLEEPVIPFDKQFTNPSIANALEAVPVVDDQRTSFSIHASFGLVDSSILIRSGFGEADTGPDMVHLHGKRTERHNGKDKEKRVPIISGTSWAGVVRHRALRIAKTIEAEGNHEQAASLIKSIFGRMPETKDKVGRASRATFDETTLEKGQTLYQTRIRIDRFTGGAFDGALFEQAPVYGTEETRIGFALHLRNPKPEEIGLFLLVLKDLWTSDLPVGGEASVGRGRLQGCSASLVHRYKAENNEEKTDEEQPDDADFQVDEYHLQAGEATLGLSMEQQQQLQKHVDALWEWLKDGSDTDSNKASASIEEAAHV